MTVAVALWFVLAAGPAGSGGLLQNAEAQAHFDKAQEAFEREDYKAAVPSLKAAYALEANPSLLYAWAQAERLAGSCERAIPLYRQFLATGPSEKQARLAETNLLDCGVEPTEPAPPPVDPDPPLPRKQPEEPVDTAPKRPWHRDWLGATLVGVGGASLVAGGVVLGLGIREGASAHEEGSEGSYFDTVDSGRTKHTAGAALLGIGGGLVVAGIIRWAVLAARGQQPKPDDDEARVDLRGLAVRVRF